MLGDAVVAVAGMLEAAGRCCRSPSDVEDPTGCGKLCVDVDGR